ncbi:hypothetical protein LSUE1_G000078 [Lachnellula suecica]|uniref:F-box domain-containing protein n=1 Tax=Lachnellula suecica TaxID=602035 RepID=A0A8T9CI66_9HELO|nr:hypothetical protein LSUE1_G000078 [Lachnellula suecica]
MAPKMSDAVPSETPDTLLVNKRRKTCHNNLSASLSSVTLKNGSQVMCQDTAVKEMWPKGLLPVELFTLIISFLPRSVIQNMRLVNKEFEGKVSGELFKVVVVPFKPEIYGINTNTAHFGAPVSQGSVMLQDKGMRVFQGFGRHIRKFAMSFEFDESKLEHPPLKVEQEAVISFWGIYRWPHQDYNRYTQLGKLEQTADETRTMAQALRFVASARDLGLSIDGGLGWLAGPDINSLVRERGAKLMVFGESRFVPEPYIFKAPRGAQIFGRAVVSSNVAAAMAAAESHNRYRVGEMMLRNAGYEGDDLRESVRLLLETEDMVISPCRTARHSKSHENEQTTTDGSSALGSAASDDEDVTQINAVKVEFPHRLKPNELTSAQREMLLETEWAQRAFMQSYAIAIIDNPMTFNHIDSLTIARLPARYLTLLCREDFWDSLPHLKKFSLAVIPEWREVVKLTTGWVEDNRVAPSQAIATVYQLLKEQISHRQGITTLHFEWLCGGEYAPGLFSRNQHIVAAPLVPKAMDMVNRGFPTSVLRLPYVEHLSFKNCWASPHILGQFLLSMKKAALTTLTLDSISLTAPLALNAQPQPVQPIHPHLVPNHAGQAAAAHNLMANVGVQIAQHHQGLGPGFQPAQPAPFLQLPMPPANATAIITPADWLEASVGSWAHLIDALTPGATLAKIRFTRDMGPEARGRATTRLKKLDFKSCGYVRLPLDFDQTILDPPDMPAPQPMVFQRQINEIDAYMMKPTDSTLAVIVNHMSSVEVATLENAFLLTLGWPRSPLLQEAQLDGVMKSGRGRFTGIIEAERPS